MASVSTPPSPLNLHRYSSLSSPYWPVTLSLPPLNLHRFSSLSSPHCPVTLSFPLRLTTSFITRLSALKTGSDSGRGRIGSQEVFGPDLLRKPPRKELDGNSEESEQKRVYEDEEDEDRWVDWEDKILEDTVPLVGFVRMLIHSGK